MTVKQNTIDSFDDQSPHPPGPSWWKVLQDRILDSYGKDLEQDRRKLDTVGGLSRRGRQFVHCLSKIAHSTWRVMVDDSTVHGLSCILYFSTCWKQDQD